MENVVDPQIQTQPTLDSSKISMSKFNYLLIILPILTFIAGGALMYVSYTKLPWQTKIQVAQETTPKSITNILSKPNQYFEILAESALIMVQLKGFIVDIGPKIQSEKGEGNNITLKNGLNTAIVFLRDQANGHTGIYEKTDSWETIAEKSATKVLKIGDEVLIQANATITEEPITSNSFYGWWYFKL